MLGVKTDNFRIVDVHSLHKSGTMFLFKFFQYLARRQQARLLSENHDPPDDYSKAVEASQSPIYRCPLRTFEVEPFRIDKTRQHRIFHLRDPRDILVSEYFSFGWIHPTENIPLDDRRSEIQKMTVDEYVVLQSEQSAWPVDQKYQPLIDYQFDPEFETVVKYEQMVTDFPRWCRQVVQACGIRFPKIVTARLAWRYRNEFKTTGETMQHKRRITPGDFRDKLKPETIEILNQRFEPILKRFDYRA
jgi:hypothetical protein